MLMRPERDEGEQAEQGRGGAGDGLIGPLALGLDAEVATDLGEGDLGAPAANEPAAGANAHCRSLGGLRRPRAPGFAKQQELLEVVAGWLTVRQAVILLADRFYGTPEMICWCGNRGWDYRLRLKGNLVARLGATRTTTGALALSGGHYFENIILTGKRITTNLGIIRDPGHTEPWIIAMSAKPGYLTTLGYAARWGIEPMFSDFKSRGFGLEQTHLRYPDRLARLILVMALALYWAVSTGMWDQANNPAPAEKNARTASRPSSPAEDFPGSPVASGAPSSFSSNASRSQSSGDV